VRPSARETIGQIKLSARDARENPRLGASVADDPRAVHICCRSALGHGTAGLEGDIIKPRLHLVAGITPLMVAVVPINSAEDHTTLATVNALLEGGADPYQPDGEGMTVFDRSRCREGDRHSTAQHSTVQRSTAAAAC
jgi:hypothetical protein